MTDLQAPTPETTTGETTTSTPETNPEAPATAPLSTTALATVTKETFWQKAEADFHEAVKWLEAEIKKI